MNEFLTEHAHEIGSFIAGLLGGGAIGSLITLRMTKSQKATHGSLAVDQSRSKAGGDVVGRDKRKS